jgi:hypothetical protein
MDVIAARAPKIVIAIDEAGPAIVGRGKYRLLFQTFSAPTVVYFNPRVDMVRIDSKMPLINLTAQLTLYNSLVSLSDFAHLKYMTISLELFESQTGWVLENVRQCTHLKHLELTLKTTDKLRRDSDLSITLYFEPGTIAIHNTDGDKTHIFKLKDTIIPRIVDGNEATIQGYEALKYAVDAVLDPMEKQRLMDLYGALEYVHQEMYFLPPVTLCAMYIPGLGYN